jgi:DHA2 family multidrug resistance protein
MGTGIINLARNVGASVGIATVTTMLQRRAQVHQAQMLDRVNNYSLAYSNMFGGLQTRLVSAGSSVSHAASQAQSMIYYTVQRQAAMMSFIDCFKLLGVVFFAVIPVMVMMKRPRRPAGDVPVH